MESALEPTYLPFSEAQLKECLATAARNGKNHADGSEDTEPTTVGIGYFKKSINNYLKYKNDPKVLLHNLKVETSPTDRKRRALLDSGDADGVQVKQQRERELE